MESILGARIERSNFKPVYDLLNALKSHDENLAFELDEMRIKLGRRLKSGGARVNIPKLIFDLPSSVDQHFSEKIKISSCLIIYFYRINI